MKRLDIAMVLAIVAVVGIGFLITFVPDPDLKWKPTAAIWPGVIMGFSVAVYSYLRFRTTEKEENRPLEVRLDKTDDVYSTIHLIVVRLTVRNPSSRRNSFSDAELVMRIDDASYCTRSMSVVGSGPPAKRKWQGAATVPDGDTICLMLKVHFNIQANKHESIREHNIMFKAKDRKRRSVISNPCPLELQSP